MRYGVTIRLDRPVSEAAELARRAEDLGFDGAWLADHYFHRDAIAALALMAARTERIELGTAVVSPFLRHPALLASSAATLQEASGGRYVLGVGPGGYEFGTQLGIDIPRPLGATREAIDVVRTLLSGGGDIAGRTFAASGAKLRWQPQDVPLYLAARGPKMLRLAGEVADGVITHGLATTHLDYVRGQLRTGGAGSTDLVLMLDVEIDDDRGTAIDALRPRCVAMAGGSYADELIAVYGLDPAEVARLRAAVRAGNSTRSLVTDDMVDAFAVGGPEEYVAERLDQIERSGADAVIVSVDTGDLESCTARLTRLAKTVIR